VSVNPFENDELDRAEREVARLPHRVPLSTRRPATPMGRVLTVAAPLCAIATVLAEMAFTFAATAVVSVWLVLLLGIAITVVVSTAAGEYGGRSGRIVGVVSGLVILPPGGIVVAWMVLEAPRLLFS
jgi:hypothetical protein